MWDVTWILYISAFIVAIAFVVLVVYLAQTLKALRTTLVNVASTVDSLEQQMTGITRETERLLNNTNKLTEDVQEKSQALDTVFVQVKEVGSSLETLNDSFRNISNQVVSGTERYSDQVEKAVEWSSAIMRIWQKWKVKQKATTEYLDHKD